MKILEEKPVKYQCPFCATIINIKNSEFSKYGIRIIKCPSCGSVIQKDVDVLKKE